MSRYHTPETIGLVYCVEVLEIVLKEHPKAKELYEDIKGCLRLPGFQETINIVERSVPDGKQIINNIVRKAGYNHKNPPPEKTRLK